MDTQLHVHDLLGAYVLDAVTPAEARLVEAHLATCDACRATVRELREVADRLPDLADEMAPPPDLRARIMGVVEADVQDAAPAATEDGPRAARPAARPVALPASRRTGWVIPRRAMPFVALAAMLAVLLVGLTVWRLYSGDSTRPAVTYAMGGTAAQPGIGGSLAYYTAPARLRLELHGLRPLPAQQAYELWLIRGHYRLVKPMGTFRPGADGRATMTMPGQDVPSYTMACITVERAAGAARPTFPLVALAPITH